MCKSFVRGLVCEWPLNARADTQTFAVNNVFLLVQNYQKWFKNYCPQINQIKQIFVVNN